MPGTTMRAAVCRAHGEPEGLVIDEVPVPEPGPGEVRVAIRAAAVNFPDVLVVANKYQVSVPTPFVPGSEFAGEVVAVGDGVTGVSMGDGVFGATMFGAFAEQVVVPADQVNPVPAGVDLEVAASFWVAYATAYHSLRTTAAVQPGDWVVVLGASGGVGLAAVELAQLLGGRVIAAASTEEKLTLCRERGAEATINYETENLKDRIKQITGKGAQVIIDPVGGSYAEQALRSSAWGGRFVTVGFAAGDIPKIPLNLVLLKGVIIKGFEMRTFGENAPVESERDRGELLGLLASGRIQPHIGGRYPLAETAAALRFVADRKVTGKVIITP